MAFFTDTETTEQEVLLKDNEIINNFNIIRDQTLKFIFLGLDTFKDYKRENIFNFYKRNKKILKGDEILDIKDMQQKIDEFLYLLENNGDYINLYNNKNNKGVKKC